MANLIEIMEAHLYEISDDDGLQTDIRRLLRRLKAAERVCESAATMVRRAERSLTEPSQFGFQPIGHLFVPIAEESEYLTAIQTSLTTWREAQEP